MKKNEIFEGTVERLDFPNRGILNIDGEPVMVKHVLPGQKIRAAAGKRRKGKCEGYFLEVLEPSPMETEKDYCGSGRYGKRGIRDCECSRRTGNVLCVARLFVH